MGNGEFYKIENRLYWDIVIRFEIVKELRDVLFFR